MRRVLRLIWGDWDLLGMVFTLLASLVLMVGMIRALMHDDPSRGALALFGLVLLMLVQFGFNNSHKRRMREQRQREREKLHG